MTALVNEIAANMVEASPLFQDTFGRVVRPLVGPANTLIVAIETARKNPNLIDLEVS